MEPFPESKKQRGGWGERVVDRYMLENRWYPIIANRVIRGGEIDRVYAYNSDSCGVRRLLLCVSEVKSTQVSCLKDMDELLSDAGLSKFVKVRQMRNLHRYGEALAAILWRQADMVELHARLFVVVRFQAVDGDALYDAPQFCGKVLYRSPAYWVLSCDPEVSSGRWHH